MLENDNNENKALDKTDVSGSYFDRVLITLKRAYSKDETVAALSKKLKDTEIELGKSIAYIHELKTWKEYFEEVFMGRKTFEVRKNDRNFQKGDILILKEWDNEKQEYTGRQMARAVSYILTGGQFGVEAGFVVMAIT